MRETMLETGPFNEEERENDGGGEWLAAGGC